MSKGGEETMKGKPWTVEEEKQLKALAEAQNPVEAIAIRLKKTPDAIMKKCNRLGIEVVGSRRLKTTTSISMPKDLLSVEETLQILAGALTESCKPGLDKVEAQRLQVISTLARNYEVLLTNFVHYRDIEVRVVEMEKKY
jgi:hypothetical protein